MSGSATETFIQETLDGLESLEHQLLALEETSSAEQINDVFRILHTIKGSAAMFGFEPLSRFAHHFETAFDLVREGKLAVTKELTDVSLASRDYMSELLAGNDDPERIKTLETSNLARNLLDRLSDLIALKPSPAQPSEGDAALPAMEPAGLRRVHIRFKPDPDELRNGMRPDLLMGELAEFGEITVRYDETDVPPLAEMEANANYLTWHVEVITDVTLDQVRDVFVFAAGTNLDIQEEQPTPAEVAPAEPGDTAPEAVQETGGEEVEQAATKAQARPDAVRVPAARVDDLMDQLGELVIAQARLDRVADQIKDQTLTDVAEEIERLVSGLRDATLAIRMLPIEMVFGKFRRVLRSLSDELGKDVTLVTDGGETELDKNVIDRLTEPLVHMIRNAVDHGLEPAEERLAAGKTAPGAVFLSARQSGGEVLISVADDGRGLDTGAIRTRALERGMIGLEDNPTEDELHRLIFEPAFSTAQSLSSVSGRGVGMDAVRKAVSDLRGTIDVETIAGRGTRVTLRLPVTLAIIDGLLVRVGTSVFVVPLSAVSECVELSAAERKRDSGRTLLQIRDELVPFLNLDEIFEFEKSKEDTRRVVIVNSDGRRVGLVVDDTLGQHQTVIKVFSRFHRDIEGFAGSTILGDGRVALILDVQALLKTAQTTRDGSTEAA